ncbi:hypothetical protein TFLX_02425 [Thermoflexales bacterium]|nr:hypothetical protein TFLX_02425 [Thermoflexales bacterium]
MPLPLDELVEQPSLVNQYAQEFDWEELLFEYELALDDIQAWLRGLNEEQIHFKPALQAFSIAEIITHNSSADELFWSWLSLLAQGRGAEIDPRLLLSGGGARHTASLPDLIAANEACRMLARNTIDNLPPASDLAATTPHPYFGALNAKGWLYFMCLHRGMHRYQCESVIDAPGFPRSVSVQTQPREVYQPSERKTWLGQEAGSQRPGASRGKQHTRGKKQAAQPNPPSVKSSAVKKRPANKKTTARTK